jgi:hypothetical protein
MPTERMGPPPGALPPMRMTASWSGSDRTYRIQVGGAKMRLNGKLPSNHHSDRRRQTLELRRKARLPVHPPSACSGLKALRNTSLAKAASRQAALAFRSLDPFRALREPDPRRRDEERPSRSEQRTLSKNQKQRLDRKSPIQVRIHLPPPALSHVRTRLRRSVGTALHNSGGFSPSMRLARFRPTVPRWLPAPSGPRRDRR